MKRRYEAFWSFRFGGLELFRISDIRFRNLIRHVHQPRLNGGARADLLQPADDHPLAELPALKPADKPGHPKSLAAAPAGKTQHAEASPKSDVLPKTVPLPVPRTAPRVVQPRRDPWPGREPWYTAGGM